MSVGCQTPWMPPTRPAAPVAVNDLGWDRHADVVARLAPGGVEAAIPAVAVVLYVFEQFRQGHRRDRGHGSSPHQAAARG